MDLPMVTELRSLWVVRPVGDPSKAAQNQRRGAGKSGAACPRSSAEVPVWGAPDCLRKPTTGVYRTANNGPRSAASAGAVASAVASAVAPSVGQRRPVRQRPPVRQRRPASASAAQCGNVGRGAQCGNVGR